MKHARRTVDIAVYRLAGWLDGFADRHEGARTMVTDDGLHLVGGDGAQAWLSTPYIPADPPERNPDDERAAFIDRATHERIVGVLLVRRGGHAAGVFHGSRLLTSKVDSSYVQGTTRAGGWSQRRFAERRANQARAAFADAADVAVRILLAPGTELAALICGGDRKAIDEVLADRRLAGVAARRTGPLLAIGDPKLRVLQDTPRLFQIVRAELDP